MIFSNHKKQLLRWCSWFFLGNIFLFFLIGINYLSVIPLGDAYKTLPEKFSLLSFASLAYLGEITVLILVLAIIPLTITLIVPIKRVIFFSSFLLMTCAVIFLSIDTVIYKLFRFHINGVMTEFIVQGIAQDVLGLSKLEVIGLIIGPCIIFCLEWTYGSLLWRNIHSSNHRSSLRFWCAAILGISIIFSYSLFFVEIKQPLFNNVFAHVSRILPFYTRLESILSLKKINQFDMGHKPADNLVSHGNTFNYPIALSCAASEKPMNLLIIVIDTWRYDMLNPKVMPFLSEFAKQAIQFRNHMSGGDATGPGIFSLFYGIPSTYWSTVSKQHRSPILIDELLNQHYKMGIFSSATLKLPDLRNTVFSAIQDLNLDTPGNTPDQRDNNITYNFKKFVKDENTSQPFFGFLFYDSAHAYCEVKNVLQPFTPAAIECNRFSLTNHSDPKPYLNRYKNALLTVDKQIKEVIETLKTTGMLDHTVVLITGDHGEEFNDNHLGYWGHSSNFLRHQVQTPLIVYWPGLKPDSYTYLTSHYDIVPTIMKGMLKCTNTASTYSVGTDLWNNQSRPYIIVGSYIDFGIIEPNRVTTISPYGSYDISQLDGKLMTSATPNPLVMNQVVIDLKRFYK